MSRIDGNQALFSGRAEAASVLAVYHHAPCENHFPILLRNSDWKLIPMKQVSTDGMSPAHVPPFAADGVELKEEMVLTVKEDEPIGIVSSVLTWREVYLRTIGLPITALSGRNS
jgi:hypothetical protein